MAESTLTILKFVFLGLLYLFLFRVMRVVYLELGGGRRRRAAPDGRSGSRTSGRRSGRGGTRLRIVQPVAHRGLTFQLSDELTVGRAPGCQVCVVDDTFVSQLHARVFTLAGVPHVEDLGSTNGTFLNGKRVESPVPLQRGDHLQVGGTVMEVV